MKLTKEWLKENNPCSDGYKYAVENLLGLDTQEILEKLMSNNKFEWGNWFLTKLMNKGQCVEYSVFAAENVLGIYEKQYPKDDRPRKAIEAAQKYLANPSADAARAADPAAAAAYAAAYAAYDAAAAAARAAAYAAADAARAAAARAADPSAAAAAADAAAAAAARADAANLKTKIINFGLELINQDYF